MVSDFIDSMGPLSQFHCNCIIIPQTPFTKGGLRFPRSRDCGVYNFNQNQRYLILMYFSNHFQAGTQM
jgi:hypothetical protein